MLGLKYFIVKFCKKSILIILYVGGVFSSYVLSNRKVLFFVGEKNEWCRRPDGVGTVTHEEKEKFQEIKERLRIQLEHQITNFRYCFPFGRPEGALKATLSLLERVS